MKLAEALILRSDMQKKLASLKARLTVNVRVQDGDEPSEAPADLIKQSQMVIGELAALIARIHQTNAQAVLADGRRLMTLLIARDELADRHKLIQLAIDSTKVKEDRYSYREIKWKVVIPVADLQKQADDLSVEIRGVNTAIQAANWQLELI